MSDPRDPNDPRLSEFARDCWQTAEDKGWHEDEALGRDLDVVIDIAEGRGDTSADALAMLRRLRGRFFRHAGVQVMEKLMLAVTELAEAAEDYRDPAKALDLLYYTSRDGQKERLTRRDAEAGLKPEGFPSELADVVIRAFELAGQLDIDLAEACVCKAAYNKTRPRRHGGKLA